MSRNCWRITQRVQRPLIGIDHAVGVDEASVPPLERAQSRLSPRAKQAILLKQQAFASRSDRAVQKGLNDEDVLPTVRLPHSHRRRYRAQVGHTEPAPLSVLRCSTKLNSLPEGRRFALQDASIASCGRDVGERLRTKRLDRRMLTGDAGRDAPPPHC